MGFVCLVALCTPTIVGAQAPSRSVLISVTEPTGMGLPEAHIQVVPTPDAVPIRMETDSKGKLAILLKPGSYTVFVTCFGFQRQAAHVEVRTGEEAQTVPIALKIAPPADRSQLIRWRRIHFSSRRHPIMKTSRGSQPSSRLCRTRPSRSTIRIRTRMKPTRGCLWRTCSQNSAHRSARTSAGSRLPYT